MALELEYELTEAEFFDYTFYTNWQAPEMRATRLRYYFLWPILSLIIGLTIFSFLNTGTIHVSSIIIGIAIFSLFVVISIARVRSRYDRYAKKLLAQPGGDVILSKLELRFDDKEVFGKTRVSEARYKWDAFRKKVLVNNCYYLYVNSRQGIIIPLRVLRDGGKREEFEKILLACFPLGAELDNLKK